MSGRIKIKPKNKDKKPKIDVFKVIKDRFKNMNELRDLIDMDPRKGLVRIRAGPVGIMAVGACTEAIDALGMFGTEVFLTRDGVW